MNDSKPAKKRDPRNGLRTSATLATLFTVLGHLYFGFEQSWAALVVALVTGYGCAILFEAIDAAANHRPPRYQGGALKMVDYLLSAHMTAITLSFLLYAQSQLWVIAFAVALAIGSKYVFRVHVGGRFRHFMNPSNLGLAVVLLAFPYTTPVGWMFTANLSAWQDWALIFFIISMGFRLNLLFTGRLPLIGAWLVGFALQGVFRAWDTGAPVAAEVLPLFNVPMVLFTFYMITDPMTSPAEPKRQVAFGLGIAFAYGVLIAIGLTFTMFYAVVVVCALRGLWMYAESTIGARAAQASRAPLIPKANEFKPVEGRVGPAYP